MRHEYNPHIYTVAYIHRYGIAQYEELLRAHTQPEKFSNSELQELLKKYKKLNKEGA